jgi:hypothetical protein
MCALSAQSSEVGVATEMLLTKAEQVSDGRACAAGLRLWRRRRQRRCFWSYCGSLVGPRCDVERREAQRERWWAAPTYARRCQLDAWMPRQHRSRVAATQRVCGRYEYRSAMGPPGLPPTATHVFLAAHETALSQLSPGGVAVCWSDQRRPSQRSANGSRGGAYAPTSRFVAPTATQTVADAQDTPLSVSSNAELSSGGGLDPPPAAAPALNERRVIGLPDGRTSV